MYLCTYVSVRNLLHSPSLLLAFIFLLSTDTELLKADILFVQSPPTHKVFKPELGQAQSSGQLPLKSYEEPTKCGAGGWVILKHPYLRPGASRNMNT